MGGGRVFVVGQACQACPRSTLPSPAPGSISGMVSLLWQLLWVKLKATVVRCLSGHLVWWSRGCGLHACKLWLEFRSSSQHCHFASYRHYKPFASAQSLESAIFFSSWIFIVKIVDATCQSACLTFRTVKPHCLSSCAQLRFSRSKDPSHFRQVF